MYNKYDKKSTSTEEQIHILKKRGLLIENNIDTRNKIENIGYFKFKGYCYPYQKKEIKDEFATNINNRPFTFEQIYNSYKFDQILHIHFLSLCNRIEAQFKSRLGTYLSKKHGVFCYKYSNIFQYKDDVQNFLATSKKIKESIERAKSRKEKYIKHFEDKYNNELPIWIIFEMISFGDLSKFFYDLKTEDKKEFSKSNYNFSDIYISSWIHFCVIIRNYSAHNIRTFYRTFDVTPKIDNKEKKQFGYDNIFPTSFIALFIIKKMCKSNVFFKIR